MCMKFQVKCKNKILKSITNIGSLSVVIGGAVYIVSAAETPEDLMAILALDIVTVLLIGYICIFKGWAEIVNSISIDGDTVKIKKLFSPSKELMASSIKRYKTDLKRMGKGPRREYIHVYYEDTFIELYEDNVCNFELLVDYLRKHGAREY